MNKKGFELTATAMVALILSVLVFAFAIYFVGQAYLTTTRVAEGIDRVSQQAAMQVFRQGGLVVIPGAKKEVRIGDEVFYWIGINNIFNQTKNMFVTLALFEAVNEDEEPLPVDATYVNDHWLLYSQGPYVVNPLNTSFVRVLVRASERVAVGQPTIEGEYVFNVCITEGPPEFECADPPLALPGNVYTGRIYKLIVNARRR